MLIRLCFDTKIVSSPSRSAGQEDDIVAPWATDAVRTQSKLNKPRVSGYSTSIN
jgi:hypothetical protein